jgi:hypothetical protein
LLLSLFLPRLNCPLALVVGQSGDLQTFALTKSKFDNTLISRFSFNRRCLYPTLWRSQKHLNPQEVDAWCQALKVLELSPYGIQRYF